MSTSGLNFTIFSHRRHHQADKKNRAEIASPNLIHLNFGMQTNIDL